MKRKVFPLFRGSEVERAELINRNQIGGMTSPLGSSKEKSIMGKTKVIIEIQIWRKLILSVCLPAPTSRVRENSYQQKVSSHN